MRLFGVSDEKLTPICVWTGIGHANHSATIVSQILVEFISEFLTPDRVSPLSRPCWVSSLNHESLDVPMKKASIVVV